MKRNIIYHTLIIVLILSVLGITSCDDSFLDRDKLGEQTSTTYFRNQKNAVASLTAVYSDLKDYRFGWANWAFGETLSDNAIYGGSDGDHAGFEPFKNFNGTSAESLTRFKWQITYRGIGKANQTIEGVEKMDDALFDSPVLKKRIIAEARFLRAYYHFELARGYGKIPIVGHQITDPKDRIKMSDRDKVFEFIVNELKLAEPDLPSKSKYSPDDLGRITQGTAWAFLAKANLYLKKWQDAYGWCEKIKNSGEYSLSSNFSDIFSLAGEHGTESIFEISFFDSPTETSAFKNNGNFQTLFHLPRNITYGYGINLPTQNLIDAFDTEGDTVRKHVTILTSQEVYDIELSDKYAELKSAAETYVDDNVKNAYAAYINSIKDKYNFGDIKNKKDKLKDAISDVVDFDIISDEERDKKLEALPDREKKLAKAFIDLHDGQDKLTFNRTGYYNRKSYLGPKERSKGIRNNPNNIRVMRYAEIYLIMAEAAYHLTKEDIARNLMNELRQVRKLPKKETVTGNELLNAIYTERRLELAMESDRYHDLVRTKRANASILKNWTEAKKYWPIPQNEIDNSLGEIVQNPGY